MFDDIILFVKVVNLGSFLAAAHRLGLAQSTISRRIKGLEDHLSVRLIKRSARHVELTPKGRVLYETFKDIEQVLNRMMFPILKSNKSVSGSLKVLLPPAFSQYAISPYIAEFCQNNPSLNISCYYSFQQVNMNQDNYDIAIIGYQPKQNTQKVKVIHKSKYIVVCTTEYANRFGMPDNLESLSKHLVVGRLLEDETPLRNLEVYDEGTDESCLVPNPFRLMANSFTQILEMVKSGMAIGGFPEECVRNEIANGSMLRVLPGYNLGSGVYYLLRNIDEQDSRYQVFYEFINECMRRLK